MYEGKIQGCYGTDAKNAAYAFDAKLGRAEGVGALPQSATEAEITHFIGRIQRQAAQLDELLVILGDRLRPITRQEPIAAQTESSVGRPTATEVGSTLCGINNHLRTLSDRVQWHLSTLEI